MACLGSRALRAQNQSSDYTAGKVAELAQRLEDLQQQVNSLRRELALANQRFSEPSASTVFVGGTGTAVSSGVASPPV
jgi:4-diphosphocytidyl-2C-methyl-D-erythritol kinase